MPTIRVVQVHLSGGTKISALAEDVESQIASKGPSESQFWELREYRKAGEPTRINPDYIVMIEAATDQTA
jgi:hypothetical protein